MDINFEKLAESMKKSCEERDHLSSSEKLYLYYHESSSVMNEIASLIEKITSGAYEPLDGESWLIHREQYHAAEIQEKTYEHDECTYANFYLLKNGTFKVILKTTGDDFPYNGSSAISCRETTETRNVDIDTMMRVTDFDAGMTINRSKTSREWSQSSYYVLCDRYSRFFYDAKNEYFDTNLRVTRKGCFKGGNLFNILYGIVRQGDRYAELLEKDKRAIAAAFEKKRYRLENMHKVMIQKAQRDETRKNEIYNQVNIMRTELSDLGFLSFWRKKELKNKIAYLEKESDSLTSISSVNAYYQAKLKQLEDMKEQMLKDAKEKSMKQAQAEFPYFSRGGGV